MKTKKIHPHYKQPRSVLLTHEEDLQVQLIAAKLSVERGRQQSKSGIMREAILMFIGLHEVGNGTKSKRGQTSCRTKKEIREALQPRIKRLNQQAKEAKVLTKQLRATRSAE